MEKAFKFLFSFGVVLFCMVIIGFFLLAIKVMLMFSDQIQMLGVVMTSAN